MNLPDTGWAEYTAEETGEYLGSLIESVIADVRAEKDQVIEAKERENELLRVRIEELDGGVAKETWVGSGQGVREASAQHHPSAAEDAADLREEF